MKKALALLLTLAMLFSCLVVGVAEEAAYCPPQKVEDVKEEWIIWEDTWPEGEVIVETEVDGVYAMYIDGVLNSYHYSVETETGEVTSEFSADHRLTAVHYWDNELKTSFDSYNGGKSWMKLDEETWTEVKVELPEGVKVELQPALGEYVYLKPVVADKLEDVDLENGKVTEYEWGISYEGKTVYASYDENGLLEYYSYWNEDHTIQVQCNWNHKITGYTYVDGYDYYDSVDGETWTQWVWDEETGDGYDVVVELPNYAEFEKLPALGEYVYSVAAPADKVNIEDLTEGRLNIWTDEEGNITDFSYQLGEVWAYYDADGKLMSYNYDSEDGKQYASFNWNHELNQIGIKLEDGNWLYSVDGETWGIYDWDEETDETTFVEKELPEGTVIEEMPPLGEPVEFEMIPVENIEDVEVRFGELWDLVDDEGNVIGKMFDAGVMAMYFDVEGKLTEYAYWNEEGTQYVTYTADDELAYIDYYTEDGKNYFYNAEKDTWTEYIYDEETEEWSIIDLEALPEGVEIDVLPPLGQPDESWYPNNTMGVVGISLRDAFPGLTKKWYNVVPVNVAVDGTTTIPLVASNMYFISNAYVTVAGDSITVTYDGLSEHGNGWIQDECVAWFTSVDQITSEWLDAPTSDLAFGQEISRANDLGDAEIALLFICNHVTYRQPFYNNGAELPRYWPNLPTWKAYRADLEALMAQLNPVVDSPDAEVVAE